MSYLPRTPYNCTSEYSGRYVVKPGDSMYMISQRFDVSLRKLIQANPHITNPSILYIGDVLCVPPACTVPLCIILKPQMNLPPWAGGIAYINRRPQDPSSLLITVYAKLPEPSFFGNYNEYRAYIKYGPMTGSFTSSSEALTIFTPPSAELKDSPDWVGYLDARYPFTPSVELSIGANSLNGSATHSGDLPLLKANIGCFLSFANLIEN